MLGRTLVLEVGRVTEGAAIAAAKLRGRGDVKAADKVAVDAMRKELGRINIDGPTYATLLEQSRSGAFEEATFAEAQKQLEELMSGVVNMQFYKVLRDMLENNAGIA